MRSPRAVCPVCGRGVAVRRNGTLRNHQGRTEKITTVSGAKAYAWCPGSGRVSLARE